MRATLLGAMALGVAISGATTAVQAQNYDAAHQVRVGAFAQFGSFSGDARQTTPAPGTSSSYSFSSLAVGATAGIEYVRPQTWSYGIEVDGAVHSGDTTPLSTIYGPNYSASLRLRAGRHVRPDIYWYGTIGLAALGAEARVPTLIPGRPVKVTGTKGGWVIGTGIERDFGPGLWFAEYLYTDYRSLSAVGADRFSFDTDSHSFRVGVKFKVGHDHYRDDVLERIGRR